MVLSSVLIYIETMSFEEVNYLYFGLSVVILIITYSCLCGTKTYLKKKRIERKKVGNGVVVHTMKGDIVMDPNIFEMHLKRMKKNLAALHKSGRFDCRAMEEHLRHVSDDVKKYINLNYDDVGKYCSVDAQRMIDDNILRERNRLKAMLKNEKDEDNQARHDFLELMIDLDIILFLIRSSVCTKGKLDLSAIDSLILELYRNNCMSVDVDYAPKSSEPMKLKADGDVVKRDNFATASSRFGNSWRTSNEQTIDRDSFETDIKHKNMSNYRANASNALVQDNFVYSYSNEPQKNKWIMSNGITASYANLYARELGNVDPSARASLSGQGA